MIVFQNSRSGWPSHVLTKFSRITLICSTYSFRTPSTSYSNKFSSLCCILTQSSLYPAIYTFSIPQMQNLLAYLKNFFMELMIIAQDIILYSLVVVVKSHENFSTTPSTVFFLIFSNIWSKKPSHCFSFSSHYSSVSTDSQTVSTFSP